jgi:hypothetical protein
MVKKDTANNMSDAMIAYKALLFDLPMAGTRWGLGSGNEKETTATAWTGYDAMVRLASRTVDGWYRSPLFAQTTARSLEGFLRWQQVGNASTKTVLTGLAQAAGLPSRADTQALQAEIRALREETTALRATPVGQDLTPEPIKSTPSITRIAA